MVRFKPIGFLGRDPLVMGVLDFEIVVFWVLFPSIGDNVKTPGDRRKNLRGEEDY